MSPEEARLRDTGRVLATQQAMHELYRMMAAGVAPEDVAKCQKQVLRVLHQVRTVMGLGGYAEILAAVRRDLEGTGLFPSEEALEEMEAGKTAIPAASLERLRSLVATSASLQKRAAGLQAEGEDCAMEGMNYVAALEQVLDKLATLLPEEEEAAQLMRVLDALEEPA